MCSLLCRRGGVTLQALVSQVVNRVRRATTGEVCPASGAMPPLSLRSVTTKTYQRTARINQGMPPLAPQSSKCKVYIKTNPVLAARRSLGVGGPHSRLCTLRGIKATTTSVTVHVCVEKCPLATRHRAGRSRDSCGKSVARTREL